MQHELPRQLLISKKMFAEARAWAKNGQNGLGAKVACWQHKLSWVKNWNEAWVSKVAWQYDRLELCYVLRVRHRPSQTSTWLLLTRLKVPEMTVWSLRKWQARSESKPCRSLSRLSSAGFVTLNTIAVSFDYAVVKRLVMWMNPKLQVWLWSSDRHWHLQKHWTIFSGLLTVAYARDVCLLRTITTNRLVCCGNSGSLVECIVRESTTLAQMPGSEVGWMRIVLTLD